MQFYVAGSGLLIKFAIIIELCNCKRRKPHVPRFGKYAVKFSAS